MANAPSVALAGLTIPGMIKFLVRLSTALGILAAGAEASCQDTMFLQSIAVYKQSIFNDTTLRAWDSVVVNPWDLQDLAKAGPIGFPKELFGPDTVIHFTKFQYDCGPDSVSKVAGVRIIDRVSSGERRIVVEPMETSIKITKLIGGGSGFKYAYGGKVQYWPILLWSDNFLVGQNKVDPVGLSYRQLFREVATKFNGNSFSVNTIASKGSHTFTPMWEEMDELLPDAFDDVSSDIKGLNITVDSLRVTILRYRYVYAPTRPSVGIRHQTGNRPRGISILRSGSGWDIRLPLEARSSIVTLGGRSVCQFPSTRRIQWDGLDAKGNAVGKGLLVFRAEGIGTETIWMR